ncbi:CAP-GLY domain-containing linker protein 1 [Linnemannia hyalina]|uniref:CAP-GLY domain-containing linker protein 1 n=1 Tax=Linnemannia hyalina TaxID=64524 RepID=A0A9P7XNB8_9FUNG|nr:CAP-GLY domain-containing linker protein 1 [Linnemannia hyalina]
MALKTPQGGPKTKGPTSGGPPSLTGIPGPGSTYQRRSLLPSAASTTKAFQNMTQEQQSLLAEAISAHNPGIASANRRRTESIGSDSGIAGASGTTNGASSPTGLASPLYVRSPQGRRPSTSRVSSSAGGAFSAISPLTTSALQQAFSASSSLTSPSTSSTSSPTTPFRQSAGTSSGAASGLSTPRLSKQPGFQRPTGAGPSGMTARNTTPGTNGALSTIPGSPAQNKLPVSPEGLELGDRVAVESMGLTGYLRFVGPAQFKTGIWAGIELDTPTGKNDGTVAGVSYFSCRPNCGIFVLAAKIVKTELLLPFSPTPTATASAITQIPSARENAQPTPPPQPTLDHAAQAASRITAGSRASKYIGVTANQLKQRNVMPQPANSRLSAQQQNGAAQESPGSPSTNRTLSLTSTSPQTTSPTPSASNMRSGLGSRLSHPGNKTQATKASAYSRSGPTTSPSGSVSSRPRTSPTPGRLMSSPRRLSSRSSDYSDTNGSVSSNTNSVLPPSLLDQATLIQMAESPQGNLATKLQQLQLDFGVAVAENNMLKTEMNQTKSQLEMTRLLEKRDLSYDERVFLSKSLGRGGIDERLGLELEELHSMKEEWEKEKLVKDQEIKSMTEKMTQAWLDAARWMKERAALTQEKVDLTEKVQDLLQQQQQQQQQSQSSVNSLGREEQQVLIETATKHLHDADEKISTLEIKLQEFQAQAVEDDAKVRTAEESLNTSTAQWAEQLIRLEEERDALQARLEDLELVLKVTTDSLRSKLEAALRDATHSEEQLHEVQARLDHEAEIRRTKETEAETKLRQADADLQESQFLLAKNEKLIKSLEEKAKDYEASISKREQEIISLKSELEDLAGLVQSDEVDRMRKVWEHEKRRLEEAIAEDITVIGGLRSEIDVLENNEEDLLLKMTELEETVIDLNEAKEALETEVGQLRDQWIEAKDQFSKERSALESKVAEVEKASETSVAEMKEKMDSLEAVASTVEMWKGQCEAMQLEVIQMNAKIEDSGFELTEAQAQRDSFKQEAEAVRKELEDRISQLHSDHAKDIAAIQKEHNATQGEKSQLADKVSELEAALALAISTPAQVVTKSEGESGALETATLRPDLEEEIANLKLMVHDLTRENVTVGNVNKKLMQEHDNLMEAHKHVETECLKLMDEVERLHAESLANEVGSEATEDKDELDQMGSSEPSEADKDSTVESLAVAAAQSQSVIRLEGLLKEKQALLDRLTKAHASEMRDLRQRYVDLDRTKAYEVGQLNKELTELESLIESKIFHEADLEEEVQRKEKQIDRLQHEISDLKRQLSATPSGPSSSPYMSTSRSTLSRNHQPQDAQHSPLAVPVRTQSLKASSPVAKPVDDEVLFCEICEIEGHDIISCKAVFSANKTDMRRYESSSSISSTPVPSEMEDDRPYCENCEEFGLHYTDECPNESLTGRVWD